MKTDYVAINAKLGEQEERVAEIEREDDALRQSVCLNCEWWLPHANKCWHDMHPNFCGDLKEDTP